MSDEITNSHYRNWSSGREAKRKCLKCQKMFLSKAVSNRICSKCTQVNTSMLSGRALDQMIKVPRMGGSSSD